MVPQLLHNTESFSCENATGHNLTLSAYLHLLYTLLCVLFLLACASQGMCWQEPAEQPHTGETLCDTRRMRNISAVEPHVVSSVHVWPRGIRVQHQRVRNAKFGNVLWTFCSTGSLTLIPGFGDPAPSLHRNMNATCVFPRAGTHVCLRVGGHPTLKVQLLLSPLNPNFFSLFPRHSSLQRPPLPDSLSF